MIRYDDALPCFAAIVRDALGEDDVLVHAFLRDASGRLTFLVSGEHRPDKAVLDRIAQGARDLAPWVDPQLPIAAKEDLFDSSIAESDAGFSERIDTEQFTGFVRLIERQVVGQDWLRRPMPPIPGMPPVVVFASHKGGVGRSTALCVAAATLSRAGFNLLAVDLDLEAPGLGAILLQDLPHFGALDYFVESGIGDVDDAFLDDLVRTSPLTENGLIDVVPAIGSEGARFPQNVLGKIARSYVERLDAEGRTVSFLDHTRRLVERLCGRGSYDAVFIDARAGLNEATAAALLGLGAEILLFGVDTPQTIDGYRYFLGHLQRFRPDTSGNDDWRAKLRMVHAKAQAGPDAQSRFRNGTFELFSDTLYDEVEGIEEAAFNFDYDDTDAPHYAWPILNDANYFEFDPLARRDQFAQHMYDRTFGPFVAALGRTIGLPL